MVRATDDPDTSSLSEGKELVSPNDQGEVDVHFVYTGEESNYQGHTSSQVTVTLGLSIFGAVVGSALPLGYNTAIVNAPMDHIKDFINNVHVSRYGSQFTSGALLWYWSISVSCTCLAAPLGCFLGSFLAFRLGRRESLMVINIITVVGSLLQSCCVAAESYEMFTLGRVFTGIQNGAGSVICPLYLCEIAPKAIRGAVGVCFQLSVVFGCFASSVISFESLLGSADQWPQLFNMNILFGLIQVIVLPFCPESPRFLLVEKQDKKGCEDSLKRLRGGGGANIKQEMKDIQAEHEQQLLDPAPTLKEFVTVNRLRRPLILACVMALSQQLSGVNSISIFSSAIFKASLPPDKVHDNPDLSNYMISAMWFVSCVATVCAVSLVERIGRKASHLIGLTSMAVCTIVVAFLFSDLETDDDQSCHGISLPSWGNYISIVFIYLYMTIFALGPSSVPWTIGPELFTVGASGKGVSIAATTNWLANFSVQLGFQPLQNILCGWVFLIFFILLVVFIVYLYLKLPETRGMTITDIVKLFE